MILIKRSPTADTRTCDFANISKETLLASSHQHIADVREGLRFLGSVLAKAAENHDFDKITDIDGFHRDFVTGFSQTEWWDRHRLLNRHHLNNADGVREDVNLIDVLDFIVDCVMAGMARSGTVYPLTLSPEILELAFQNTVELMKRNVLVVDRPDTTTTDSVPRAVEPADVGEALPSGLGGTVGTNEVCKCGHKKIYHEYLNTSPGDPVTVIKGCDHSGCDCNKFEEAHLNG